MTSRPVPFDHDLPIARDAIRQLRGSRIREVSNAGLGLPDVLPFWFGESDRMTPAFIRDAASAALARGATFYTHNLGIPALRAAIADYATRLHGPTRVDNVVVTSAGVNALMLAAQLIIGPGDRAVAVTPLWPNFVEIPKILGAHVDTVSLDFGADGWTLDVDRLLTALTPGTRLLIVNSPNNPTGWVMPSCAQQVVLDHCRRHGIWVIADEVYERLYFGDDSVANAIAPSFLDLAARDERVIVVNSFSKSWLMTGWRLGWMTLPASLVGDLGKLIEYNTSCAPSFVQEAGVVAITEGESFTRQLVVELRAARDHLVNALGTLPGVEVHPPAGAMYVFFRVEQATDSLEFCKRMVRDARVGLAPGSAFGDEGEGYVRWCYACEPARLDAGVSRIRRALAG
jgi:aspartate/methionine/tyrosine aminotransferase